MRTQTRLHLSPRRPEAVSPSDESVSSVLDVTKFYSFETSGGVRTYIDAKTEHLRREGVRHALVVPGGTTVVRSVGARRVYEVKGPRIPKTTGYRLLLSHRAIRTAIENEQPDVVEVGSPFLVPLLTRFALRGRRIPMVGFYHSDVERTFVDPYVGNRPRWFGAAARSCARSWVRRTYAHFDVTIAASKQVVSELRALGLRNVEFVPLGVDLETFHPERRSGRLRQVAGVEEGRPIALFCGRFCPEKRLDVVLDAHARMNESMQPHLVLVGDGSHGDDLRERVREAKHVTTLPFESDRTRLAELMAGADFYVAAGPAETFGLAVAEAMACGLAVVGVSSGAVPDRIAGTDAGVLYEHENPDSCAASLLEMTVRVSPRMRDLARGHAEATMGWDRTFGRLLEIYRSLAANVPATRSSGRSTRPDRTRAL